MSTPVSDKSHKGPDLWWPFWSALDTMYFFLVIWKLNTPVYVNYFLWRLGLVWIILFSFGFVNPPPPYRPCIAIFVVAERWLLLDIEWFFVLGLGPKTWYNCGRMVMHGLRRAVRTESKQKVQKEKYPLSRIRTSNLPHRKLQHFVI